MKTDRRPRGHVTRFGYRRFKAPGERRLKMEHVWALADQSNAPQSCAVSMEGS